MSESKSLLINLIDEAFDRKSWHGPSLRGTIRRVDAAQAMWRPSSRRKCIAEIVVHAAYWKYAVRRRLLGEKRGSFVLGGSNWFALPKPWTDAAWRDAVKLLDGEHSQLRAAVAGLKPVDLERVPVGGKYSVAFLLRGIAFHDIYHAGQIQTLKALRKP